MCGFAVRIYCKCHWPLQNASLMIYAIVAVIGVVFGLPSPFHVIVETEPQQNNFVTRDKSFIGFLYWILPFLLMVSFLQAFQPSSSWTCNLLPFHLKSGLNIFAPANIPVGLFLLWFQRNWDMLNSHKSLAAYLYNCLGLLKSFETII